MTSDEEVSFELHLSDSNKRYSCFGDSEGSCPGYGRKRSHYEDSPECSAEGFSGDGEEYVDEEVEDEMDSHGMGNDREIFSSASSWKRDLPIGIDRLSALPDSVLIRILSFLNMQEAAITCVLSKRWKYLWTDSTSLNFCESSKRPERIRKFVAWVHRTLVLCSGNHLKHFEVGFMYDTVYASDVNMWVEFAIKNKAKDVALLLTSFKDSYLYTLPQTMYSNSSLTSLSLRGCIMSPPERIDWGSLTALYLENVKLDQLVIEEMLLDCPVLNELVLIRCSGFRYLGICSKSVHSLTVRDWVSRAGETLLEISAPHIRSLEISVELCTRELHLTNISSLVRANIDFNGSDCAASSVSEKEISYTTELFEKIKHVEKLEVGRGCIEVLSVFAVKGCLLLQSARRHLIVNALTDRRNIPGIISLLESSRKLETLVINGHSDPYEKSINCASSASQLSRDMGCCLLLDLKTAHITDFVHRNLDGSDLAGEPMLKLVQGLLRRASNLEKMVLNVEEYVSSPTYIKIAQKLLSYPRMCIKAAILLL